MSMPFGHRHSAETIRKISESSRGKTISEEQRQKTSETLKRHFEDPKNREKCASWTGRHHSEATRRKMSDSKLGGNNHNWRGGTNRKYPSQFNAILKDKIMLRDDNSCQMPGCSFAPPHTICVHHINYYRADNADANLISLCRGCHNKTTFGDRISWQLFFTGLQELRGIYRAYDRQVVNPKEDHHG